MDELLQAFNLQELAGHTDERAIWGALVATLCARCGGDVVIYPQEMAAALSKKEMILERVENDIDFGLSIRLTEYTASETN
jgi:hypothetical protein